MIWLNILLFNLWGKNKLIIWVKCLSLIALILIIIIFFILLLIQCSILILLQILMMKTLSNRISFTKITEYIFCKRTCFVIYLSKSLFLLNSLFNRWKLPFIMNIWLFIAFSYWRLFFRMKLIIWISLKKFIMNQ